MEIDFLKKKTGQLTYKQLSDGSTYKCVACDREDYIGRIIHAQKYGDMFGVWLNLNGVLSEMTVNRKSMLFEEFKCKLVEIE